MVIAGSVILGMFLHEIVRWIPAWVWMIILIALFSWVYVRFFNEHQEALPVMVQNLVDAASAGKWVTRYEATEAMFKTLPG